MELVNSAIASGKYNVILAALKAFRNAVVFGCKIRAPHTLVVSLVWSKNRDPMTLLKKIYSLTSTHALNLAKFAALFKLLFFALGKVNGGQKAWHAPLSGLIAGSLFWGDPNPVNVQVLMYLVVRSLSGFVHIYLGKTKPPAYWFRIYAGITWACAMFLYYSYPETLQTTLHQSMEYIYTDSDRFTGLYDLLVVNKAQ